ncbi:hypothetical protein J4477_00635 [Candidatus Pacearchaeota archaeon]|nr:hypothetical protein [Candidatus Pacearchaeota archaeon]
MEIKTIKNVNEETWREFIVIVAKNNVKMSALLKMMVKEFEKNNKNFWNEILNGEKLMTDREAEEMKRITVNIIKEKGFRE